MEDVTFVIPAYNEENSIGELLIDIQQLYPSSLIIVINNNSTDRTQEIAEKFGVFILPEKRQGKGNAVRTGFKAVKTEYAVMLDADNTYDPNDARKLIKPLKTDKADVVLGSRLKGKKEEGAITKFNIIGNHILSFTASLLYTPISDVCTGYWAFKKEVIDHLLETCIEAVGFEIEAEMFAKVSKNFKIMEVPIKYNRRKDSPKLNSVNDGWRIFKMLFVYKLFNNTIKSKRTRRI